VNEGRPVAELNALALSRCAGKAHWLKPEIRVRAQFLKAKGTLGHATVKSLLI
jgi:hypothetical protein